MARIAGLTSLVTTLWGAPFGDYLHSISGLSPQWNLQETTGLVAGAWNTAVPLGRELVINGATGFTFTADDPDLWSVTEVGDATSNITENPATQCQIISDGTLAQMILVNAYAIGKTYQITVVTSAAAAGSILVTGGVVSFSEAISTATTTQFNVTPEHTSIIVKRAGGVCDITVASISVKQTGILASSVYPGAELLNTAGASGTATAANWTAGSAGTFTNPVVGTLRIERVGPANNPVMTQIAMTVGKRYVVAGEARVTGGAEARLTNIGAAKFSSTSATYEEFSVEFVATNVSVALQSVTSTGTEYTEWRNISVREANPLNGNDTATVVGVATGLASMPYARTFNGATSYIDITSAEYNSILDPATFSAYIFAKPSWDANERDFFSHTVDANNYIRVGQSATAGTARWEIMADGNLNSRTLATGAPVAFGLFGISCEGGVMKAIYNGGQVGADIALVGTVIGNFLTMIIGARNDTPTNVVDGDMMQYDSANRALTSVEWSDIDQRSGI